MQSWNQWSSSGSGYPPPLLPSSNSIQAGQSHSQSDSSLDPHMSSVGYNMYCPSGMMPVCSLLLLIIFHVINIYFNLVSRACPVDSCSIILKFENKF